MSIIRKFIRYAVEDTPGTYQTPDTAIPHHEGTLNVNTLAGDVVERNVELLTMDTLASLRAGEHGSIQVEFALTHAATPGTPPPWAPLLLASACAETTGLTEVTGTLAAVGTDSDGAYITLDSGASAADGAYVGRYATGHDGDFQWVIHKYVGATKKAYVVRFDATAASPAMNDEYIIPAATRYTPVSAGFGSLSCDYWEIDEDLGSATQWSFKGCRGEATLTFNEKAEPVMRLDLVGVSHAGPSSVSAPTMDYSDWGVPVIPSSAATRLPAFHASSAQIARNLSFMTGAKATFVSRLNDGRTRIPARPPTATVDMDQVLSSGYDLDGAISAGTPGRFLFIHGITGDAPIVLFAAAMQVTGKNPGASRQDGVYNVTANLAFRTAGGTDDSWMLHC